MPGRQRNRPWELGLSSSGHLWDSQATCLSVLATLLSALATLGHLSQDRVQGGGGGTVSCGGPGSQAEGQQGCEDTLWVTWTLGTGSPWPHMGGGCHSTPHIENQIFS